MTSWEYAEFYWPESAEPEARRYVAFSHQEPWEPLDPGQFWATLRRLGDEGWEAIAITPGAHGTVCWLKRPRP